MPPLRHPRRRQRSERFRDARLIADARAQIESIVEQPRCFGQSSVRESHPAEIVEQLAFIPTKVFRAGNRQALAKVGRGALALAEPPRGRADVPERFGHERLIAHTPNAIQLQAMLVCIDRELIIALREMHQADVMGRFHHADLFTDRGPNRERLLKRLKRQPVRAQGAINIAGRVEI